MRERVTPPDSARPFDLSTHARVVLALTKHYYDAPTLLDSNPILRMVGAIGMKIAKLFNKFFSPVEGDIFQSMEFIESIQGKLRELGTTPAKNNNDIITSKIEPLKQENEVLNTKKSGLMGDFQENIKKFHEAARRILREQKPLEGKTQLTAFDKTTAIINTQLDALLRSFNSLARRITSEKPGAIQLLPEHLQNTFRKEKKSDRLRH